MIHWQKNELHHHVLALTPLQTCMTFSSVEYKEREGELNEYLLGWIQFNSRTSWMTLTLYKEQLVCYLSDISVQTWRLSWRLVMWKWTALNEDICTSTHELIWMFVMTTSQSDTCHWVSEKPLHLPTILSVCLSFIVTVKYSWTVRKACWLPW